MLHKTPKAAFVILCIFFLGTSLFAKSKQEKPNVIIILSDDQGWGDVGFNGGKDIKTPNLDAMANSGVIFSDGYASHPYCSPSRAGLMTGRYQQRFGHECNMPYDLDFEDETIGLPLNEIFISNVLKDNGYATCAIGKWHLGDNPKYWPTARGFDHWFGFYGGGMSYWGDTGKKPKRAGVLRNGEIVPQQELSYLTDDFSREAASFIEMNNPKKTGKPFFMYLAYNAPHGPIQATKEYLNEAWHIEKGDRAAYAAMVMGMDKGIGTVQQKLNELGILENTLIIFYSDNGGHHNGASSLPYRGHKGSVFEGGIRVPFMMYWPKGIKKAQVYKKPIIALDVFPTILAAANIDVPEELDLDGKNLFPYLEDKVKGMPHEKLFWRYSGGTGYAVRRGNYKLVMSALKNDTYLFNLKNDPYEMKDIAAEHPEILQSLLADYTEWSKGTIQPKWNDPHMPNVIKTEKARQEFINKACKGEKVISK